MNRLDLRHMSVKLRLGVTELILDSPLKCLISWKHRLVNTHWMCVLTPFYQVQFLGNADTWSMSRLAANRLIGLSEQHKRLFDSGGLARHNRISNAGYRWRGRGCEAPQTHNWSGTLLVPAGNERSRSDGAGMSAPLKKSLNREECPALMQKKTTQKVVPDARPEPIVHYQSRQSSQNVKMYWLSRMEHNLWLEWFLLRTLPSVYSVWKNNPHILPKAKNRYTK